MVFYLFFFIQWVSLSCFWTTWARYGPGIEQKLKARAAGVLDTSLILDFPINNYQESKQGQSMTTEIPLILILRLQIMVSDSIHNNSVMLEIRLKDVNDRDPEFNTSIKYSANVTEVCTFLILQKKIESRKNVREKKLSFNLLLTMLNGIIHLYASANYRAFVCVVSIYFLSSITWLL